MAPDPRPQNDPPRMGLKLPNRSMQMAPKWAQETGSTYRRSGANPAIADGAPPCAHKSPRWGRRDEWSGEGVGRSMAPEQCPSRPTPPTSAPLGHQHKAPPERPASSASTSRPPDRRTSICALARGITCDGVRLSDAYWHTASTRVDSRVCLREEGLEASVEPRPSSTKAGRDDTKRRTQPDHTERSVLRAGRHGPMYNARSPEPMVSPECLEEAAKTSKSAVRQH